RRNVLPGSVSTCCSSQSQMKPSRLSTSARPHLTFEDGMSTCGRSIRTALRMRVSMSAIGSVIIVVEFPLPARLLYARNQPHIRQLAETNSADAELAIHRPRPAAELTAALSAGTELRLAIRLGNF